jgi:hypothetical protein
MHPNHNTRCGVGCWLCDDQWSMHRRPVPRADWNNELKLLFRWENVESRICLGVEWDNPPPLGGWNPRLNRENVESGDLYTS